MFWATLSFVACVITSSIGMIIYSNSLDHIRTGIEILPQQLNTTTSAKLTVLQFLTVMYKNQRLCSLASIRVKNEVVHLVEQLSGDIEDMDLNQFGYLENFPAARMHKAVKVILNLTSQLSSFKPSVVEFRLHVEDMFSEVLQYVSRETVKLQRQLAYIFTERNFSQRLHDLLGYTLLIPFTLLFLSVIGLAGISVSWAFYSSRDRHSSRESRRGAFSMVAASALTTTGYTAMFVGALLCLMTA
ncbi:unnamed protein product [Angiostrongylus costaricensis]|uniref:Protein tweety homolog n=1 Tax=Angiostrongylus costaricensis TaxID=334426 RepID=A0A0R3PXQ8_ANGCS|nr:unnamed protein product [Angiostrongylus costaricensis]